MRNKPVEFQLMQGNEACARGAVDAGVRFFAGYPITPSTEIAEWMARELPVMGGKFIQMEDEIASLAAVIGASLTGIKAMTATSGPGFSLMQENIGYACMIEMPCLVVNVQRGGPSTGRPTAPSQGDVMQARWGTHGDHPCIALSPWSVQEAYQLTMEAVNLSERFRTPVILLMDEVIGHLREGVALPDPRRFKSVERPRPAGFDFKPFDGGPADTPPVADLGTGYRCNYTGLTHTPDGQPTNDPVVTDRLVRRLSNKVLAYRDEVTWCDEYRMEDAKVALFAYGCTARSSLRALHLAREEGIKAGMLRAKTIWPFPEKEIDAIAAMGIPILVPEMNLGQLVREVERVANGRCKVRALSRVDGQLFNPVEILAALKEER